MIGRSFSRIDLMLTHFGNTAQYCKEKLYLHIRKWLMQSILQQCDPLHSSATWCIEQYSNLVHWTIQKNDALNNTEKWCTEQYRKMIHWAVKRHNTLYSKAKWWTKQYILWIAALFSILDRSKRQQMIDHKCLGKIWLIEHNTSRRIELCTFLFFWKVKITNQRLYLPKILPKFMWSVSLFYV